MAPGTNGLVPGYFWATAALDSSAAVLAVNPNDSQNCFTGAVSKFWPSIDYQPERRIIDRFWGKCAGFCAAPCGNINFLR